MRTKLFFIAILPLLGMSCHTFMQVAPDYADLPVDDLKTVATEIERAVHEQNREPGIANRGGIVVEDENITQAIRSRAARAHLIEAFLETGHLIEANNGLVSIIRSSDYKKLGSSRDRDRNAQLVIEENNNRWMLYEGILNASNFSPKSLPAVQRIFFDARMAFRADGTKYEDENGKIAVKGGVATPTP